MRPRCHIDTRGAFFILWVTLFTPSIWKEGFCWLDPEMIHDLNKKAAFHFHASMKSDFFLGRKPYNYHVMVEGFNAYTDSSRTRLALQAGSVLSTDLELILYPLLLWDAKPQELDKVFFDRDPDMRNFCKIPLGKLHWELQIRVMEKPLMLSTVFLMFGVNTNLRSLGFWKPVCMPKYCSKLKSINRKVSWNGAFGFKMSSQNLSCFCPLGFLPFFFPHQTTCLLRTKCGNTFHNVLIYWEWQIRSIRIISEDITS